MSERVQTLLIILGIVTLFAIAMTDPWFADKIMFWR